MPSIIVMDIIKIINVCIIFLLGFLIASFIGLYLISGLELPFGSFINNLSLNPNFTEAPSDYIKEGQIQIYENSVVINVEGASIGRYASTGSMIPILNEYSNGIKIKPKSEEEIKVGDIITFDQNGVLIVHRVIVKDTDDEGVYFITKGDNNLTNDGKIRFEDIRYKTIGIIW